MVVKGLFEGLGLGTYAKIMCRGKILKSVCDSLSFLIPGYNSDPDGSVR